MGCDIDFIFQVYQNGEWKDVDTTIEDGWRNYDSFGLLAGVRSGAYEPIAEPRGLPRDMAYKEYSIDECGIHSDDYVDFWAREHADGYHDHSFLTLEDFDGYPWDLYAEQERQQPDFDPEWSIKQTMAYRRIYPEMRRLGLENKVASTEVRMVFCFNS